MSRLLFLLASILLVSCNNSKPELHVFIWGDFIKQELIESFESRFNCRVIIDTYDSNEAMFAKLKSGASGYDLIFPTGYILKPMKEQKMLYPLDKSLIPNLKNIDFTALELLDEDQHEDSVPYALTFSAIAYRKDRVSHLEPTWNVFSRADLKGRMTMLNDMREVLGAALLVNGFSINTINKSEIEIAAETVINWKRNLAKFESEQYKNGIASAEYLAVQGYSSDIMQIREEDEGVVLMLPDEGGVFSCDYVCIPSRAVQLKLAHSFINFLLEPEIAAINMETNFYLSPNKLAYKLLNDELRTNPAIFPPKDFLKKSESIRDVGSKINLYTEAWESIKSAK
jgi:spermidine/putrescine transport system substrate-binding protein